MSARSRRFDVPFRERQKRRPIRAGRMAAGVGRADETDGEPLVVRHSDDRRLTVSGEALDADLLRVHGFIRLEVVERPAGAPRPGPERAPIVELARLALVAQPDDAAGQ